MVVSFNFDIRFWWVWVRVIIMIVLMWFVIGFLVRISIGLLLLGVVVNYNLLCCIGLVGLVFCWFLVGDFS